MSGEGQNILVTERLYGVHIPLPTTEEPRSYKILKPLAFGGLKMAVATLTALSAALGGNIDTRTVLFLSFSATLARFTSECCVELLNKRRDHIGQGPNPITGSFFMLSALSCCISGIVPPTILYNIPIERLEDKHGFWWAGASAFVLILLLSISKAYVARPPRPYFRIVSLFLLQSIIVPVATFFITRFSFSVKAQPFA